MTMHNKHMYKLTEEVVDAVFGVEGAVVFGGYVRDKIRHDHMAKRFYDEAGDDDNYQDTNVVPELRDRLLVSSDVDCFMSSDSISELEGRLKDRGLKILQRRECQSSIYCGDSDVKLLRMKVALDIPPVMIGMLRDEDAHLYRLSVSVDVVHTDDTAGKEPPFGKVDFLCNALVMDQSRQIRVSSHVFEEMNIPKDILARYDLLKSIVEDIKTKTARALACPPNRRVMKMIWKQWNIVTNNESYKITPRTDDSAFCIICHDTFLSSHAQVKRHCCAALYHRHCFVQVLKSENFNDKCPMCRDYITVSEQEEFISMMDF